MLCVSRFTLDRTFRSRDDSHRPQCVRFYYSSDKWTLAYVNVYILLYYYRCLSFKENHFIWTSDLWWTKLCFRIMKLTHLFIQLNWIFYYEMQFDLYIAIAIIYLQSWLWYLGTFAFKFRTSILHRFCCNVPVGGYVHM